MVLVSNNCRREVHEMAERYPGVLGHLYGPGGFRGPFPGLPYALDNGAYGAFVRGEEFDAGAFLALCDRAKASRVAPMWLVVPDAVGDRRLTLIRWADYAERLRSMFGWPLAFAVQDGMTCDDVPNDVDVVFVGGTTQWKWATVEAWCGEFPRVHVGRVNAEYRLWQLRAIGAESCDGSGWFRAGGGDRSTIARSRQVRGLRNYVTRVGQGLGPCPMIETTDLFGDLRYVGGRAR